MLVLETLVAGFVGTLFMTGLMTMVHRAAWANADMVRALGSLVTHSEDNAVGVGVLIHLASGLLFAFPYTILLGILSKEGETPSVGVATVLGLLHGIIVAFLLVAAVAERHPIERFRKAGFEVAVAHVLGHVGYGFGVGVTAAVLDIHWKIGA